MAEISKEYALLFNGITDALNDLQAVSHRLAALQIMAEELYISGEDQHQDCNQDNRLPA